MGAAAGWREPRVRSGQKLRNGPKGAAVRAAKDGGAGRRYRGLRHHDATEHNVTINKVNAGTFPPGAKLPYKFAKPGVYKVTCSLHPEMDATITVK